MRNYIVGLGVFVAAGIVAAGIGLNTNVTPPATIEKIKMADANNAVFALVYLAESLGYFAEEGLEVEYDTYTSGRDALASVLAGKNDIATVYATPIVVETFNGAELSVITELHNSNKNTGLVARKDRGIFSARDLKGKRIAVPINTNAEFFLKLFLTSQGIDQSEITFVPSKPQDAVEALKTKDIDAVAAWNPNLYHAQKSLNSDRLVSFYSDVYTEVSVLALKKEVADKRGEALTRLLRALVRAEEYLTDNPSDSKERVISRLPKHVQETSSLVWDSFSPEIKLGSLLLSSLQGQAEWYRNNGKFNTPVPDFKTAIDSRFLTEVSPESVTIEWQ